MVAVEQPDANAPLDLRRIGCDLVQDARLLRVSQKVGQDRLPVTDIRNADRVREQTAKAHLTHQVIAVGHRLHDRVQAQVAPQISLVIWQLSRLLRIADGEQQLGLHRASLFSSASLLNPYLSANA